VSVLRRPPSRLALRRASAAVLAAVCVVALLASRVFVQAPDVPAPGSGNAPFTQGIADAASLKQAVEARVARARTLLDEMLAVKGARTVRNTLTPYDELSGELLTAGSQARLMAALHPDEAVRKAGDELNRTVSALGAEIPLRPEVYAALAGIDLNGADRDTRYYVERELRDFRLSGVDKPADVRDRVKVLRDELTQRMDEFARNIRAGTRRLTVMPAELDGLPADFVKRHAPDSAGAITLTTDDVDARPVFMYAKNDDLRRRMMVEVYNLGAPANLDVLRRILLLRAEIASLLGYPNWAAYDTASRMAGDVQTVTRFIDRIVEVSGPKAAREHAELVARKQRDVPGATLNLWDRTYYSELVRRASYDFDSQSVRPYFPFDRVLGGVLDVTGRVFGLSYQPDSSVPVWHPSVRVYAVRDGSRLIGRVYLDLHRRSNKVASGASAALVRNGGPGRPIPEAVLSASLPGGEANDPGLMTHSEVTTLFHEFGHVVHRLVGGHHRWQRLSSTAMERDFTEAPSQMLEEWAWDPRTLASFARHYQTGEAIPERLVLQMRRASDFGKAIDVRGQMVLAKVSLSYHDRSPQGLDTTALWHEIHNMYSATPYPEGSHREASFPHIAQTGYASTYYAYMWSLVIAKDMFGAFEGKDLLAAGVGRGYRDAVFAPGSSKPAADAVRSFLGRPFNSDAWERWLNRETPPVATN
jgi:thimet oligopeptidase